MEQKTYKEVPPYFKETENRPQCEALSKIEKGRSVYQNDTFPDLQIFSRVVSAVFFIFTLHTGLICCSLWIIMRKTNPDERLFIATQYHTPALLYFVLTAFMGVSSRKYHHYFPENIFILAVELSGLAVLLFLQILSFGADRSKESDIPAIRFAFVCCFLLWLLPQASIFPSAGMEGRLFRLLIVAITAAATVVGYRLDKEFRFTPLVLLCAVIVYILLRAESLALNLQREDVEDWKDPRRFNDTDPASCLGVYSQAVYVALQILLLPMIGFTGLFSFAFYVSRPRYILP